MLYTAAAGPSPSSDSGQNRGQARAAALLEATGGGGGSQVLGDLLLLEPPFSGRSQHPPTQGHRVGGRAF